MISRSGHTKSGSSEALSKALWEGSFTNQLREKVGVIYGNPETTTGGRALKFYASIRLDIRKIDSVKSGGDVVANRVRVKVVKNKVAPPFKQCEFDISFGSGISRTSELVDLAVAAGVMQKAGAWFSYNGVNIGQGKDNTITYLKDNPETFKEIDRLTRSALGLISQDTEQDAVDAV